MTANPLDRVRAVIEGERESCSHDCEDCNKSRLSALAALPRPDDEAAVEELAKWLDDVQTEWWSRQEVPDEEHERAEQVAEAGRHLARMTIQRLTTGGNGT